MIKTKLENFISDNGLTAEIELCPNDVKVTLYKKGDLYLYRFSAPTMNEAIELSVNDYLKRKESK